MAPEKLVRGKRDRFTPQPFDSPGRGKRPMSDDNKLTTNAGAPGLGSLSTE
jgi:hypothetical protein